MKAAVAKAQLSQVLPRRWQSPGIWAATLCGIGCIILALTAEPTLLRRYVHITGSLAGKLSFLVVLLLPAIELQRRRMTLFAGVTRFLRKWHIPLAILVLGCTIAHIYLAVSSNVTLNFRNITGVFALLIMIGVYGSGLFIHKVNWRKVHLVTGVTYIGVLLLHMAR